MAKVNNIIVGAGSFGSEVARYLCDKGENVVIIDKERKAFDDLKDYSFFMELGDALDLSVLERNDISSCKAIILATNNDNTNLYLADIAKELYGVDKIYIRLKDARKKKLVTTSNTYCVCPFALSIADFAEKYY